MTEKNLSENILYNIKSLMNKEELIILPLKQFSYLVNEEEELNNMINYIINTTTEENIKNFKEEDIKDFKRLKELGESNIPLNDEEKKELRELGEKFIESRTIIATATDGEAINYNRWKELNEKGNLKPFNLNRKEYEEYKILEKELSDYIWGENGHYIKELAKLKKYYNKYCIVFPTGEKDENNREIEKMLILDGEKIELKTYDYKDKKSDIVDKKPEGTFYYNECMTKDLFFEIIKDISINGEKSIYLKTNENGINIAHIVLKYCLEKGKVTIDDFIVHYNKNEFSLNDDKIIKIFCKVGSIEIIKFFIQNGVDIRGMGEYIFFSGDYETISLFEEKKDLISYNMLKGACKGCHKEAIDYLNDTYGNEIINKNNLIKAFSAITNPRMAKIIFDKAKSIGYNNINEKDRNGKSALYYAFEQKNIYAINLLLSQPNINLFQTILEIVSEILPATDIIPNSNIMEASRILIFYYATVEKNIEITKILLQEILERKKENLINKRDSSAKTILHYAVENEDIRMVNLLLQQTGIDVNIRDIFGHYTNYQEGKTPLHIAIEKRNIKIINLLLSHPNIDVNIVIKKNKNQEKIEELCLLNLTIKTGDIEIINSLLSHPNIDVNIGDNIYEKYNGKILNKKKVAPINLAVEMENIELVKLLLSHPKIDKNAKYIEKKHNDVYLKYTPLGIAIKNNNLELFKILISQPEIDINAKYIEKKYKNYYKGEDSIEYTLLGAAIEKKNMELINLLLSHPEIDINAKCITTHTGWHSEQFSAMFDRWTRGRIEKTVLHMVVEEENIELIKLLLSQPKIDINAKYILHSKYGYEDYEVEKTALHMAVEKMNFEIIKLLLEFMQNKDIVLSKKEKNDLISVIIGSFSCCSTLICFRNNENNIISIKDIENYLKKRCINIQKQKYILLTFYKNKDFEIFEYFLNNDEWKRVIFETIVDLSKDIYNSNNPELINKMEKYYNSLDLSEKIKIEYINNKLKEIFYYEKLNRVIDSDLIFILVDKYSNFIEKDNLIKSLFKINNPELAERVFTELEKNGYDINMKDENEYTAIYYAFKNKNLEVSKILFKKMSKNLSEEKIKYLLNLDYYDAHKNFKKAIEDGNIELIQLLFNYPTPGPIEEDELIQAFSKINDLEVAKVIFNEFLNRKYDVNKKDEEGKTLFYYAVESGNTELVEFLLTKQGIDFNIQIKKKQGKYTYHNETPLNRAIRKNDLKMVQILLNNPDVNPNLMNDEWQKNDNYPHKTTPLYKAIIKNNLKIIELLLCNPKLDINMENNCKTPLQYAIENEKSDVVRLLLTHPNIKINIQNRWDYSIPIYTAVEKGNSKIVQYLLKYPTIDINESYKDLINMSVKKGDKEISEILLHYMNENNLSLAEEDKNELYLIAIEINNLDIVDFILSREDLSINTKSDETSFYMNIKKGDTEIAKTLLHYAYRNDLLLTEKNKNELLPIAIKDNNLDMVNFLISQENIDINAKSKNGKTPLYIAVKNGNKQIVELLYSKIKDKKLEIDEELKTNVDELLKPKILELDIKEGQKEEKIRKKPKKIRKKRKIKKPLPIINEKDIDEDTKNLSNSMTNDKILSNAKEIGNELLDSDKEIGFE